MRPRETGRELIGSGAEVEIRSRPDWAVPAAAKNTSDVPIVTVFQPLRPFDLPRIHFQGDDRVDMIVGRKAFLRCPASQNAVDIGRIRRGAVIVAGADEYRLALRVDHPAAAPDTRPGVPRRGHVGLPKDSAGLR